MVLSNRNWVLKQDGGQKYFRSSNPNPSFQSTTFQFILGKVSLALQKFHKAQTSHQHATDAPPMHLVCYTL